MDLQTRCAPSNDFSVSMVLIQWLFWFIHIGFFFTLFSTNTGRTKTISTTFTLYKVCWLRVVLFSHAALTHTHRIKHYHEQDGMIEKQKIVLYVTTDWWFSGENWWKKAGWNGKKMSCAVTYNGEGMVEAGIGSEKFLRIRILEIFKETPFFGPSS